MKIALPSCKFICTGSIIINQIQHSIAESRSQDESKTTFRYCYFCRGGVHPSTGVSAKTYKVDVSQIVEHPGLR